MGFRFRRSIRILPGVTLNVGKKSGSISLGGRGARITIGPKGTRKTVGIPGTGLSYTEQKKHDSVNTPSTEETSSSGTPKIIYWSIAILVFYVVYFIASKLL